LKLNDAYRSFTMVTLLQGFTGLIVTLVLYQIMV